MSLARARRAAPPVVPAPVLMLILALALATGPAAAQENEEFEPPEVSLSDFAGTWEGDSVVVGPEAGDTPVETRDLDVVIAPRDGGFRIGWTAFVIRGTPEDPDVERREMTVAFVPTERDYVFRNVESGNPLEGEVLSWARLHGRTLSVYRMRLNEHGGYVVAVYDRTLVDDGMRLFYERLSDGEPVRTFTGHLTRAAP